jgi:ribosomal-protein-alanine N-acetyltransferase
MMAAAKIQIKKPEYRLATFEDIEVIKVLDVACGLNAWGPEIYKGLILHDSCEVTVCLINREVVGFCAIKKAPPELDVLKIGVRPDRQGEGIGTALMQGALERAAAGGCCRCFLEVRWSNERAISFYRKEGFEIVGVRRQYYRNPVEDARVMRKIMESGA